MFKRLKLTGMITIKGEYEVILPISDEDFYQLSFREQEGLIEAQLDMQEFLSSALFEEVNIDESEELIDELA